jgi:hypothetical protein
MALKNSWRTEKPLDMLSAAGKEKVTKPDENTNATGFLIGSKPHEPKTGAMECQ